MNPFKKTFAPFSDLDSSLFRTYEADFLLFITSQEDLPQKSEPFLFSMDIDKEESRKEQTQNRRPQHGEIDVTGKGLVHHDHDQNDLSRVIHNPPTWAVILPGIQPEQTNLKNGKESIKECRRR